MNVRTGIAAALAILALTGCQKKEQEPPIRFYGSTVVESAEPIQNETASVSIGELTFENQDGKAVNLNGLEGSPALLSFIFTRCGMPNMCPAMTQRMAEAQAELTDAERKRVKLISMTFDPVFDTAAVLKQYGEAYGADFECWEFWRGSPEDVEAVMTKSLAWAEPSADGFSHNPVTVLLDGDGKMAEALLSGFWDPKEAVESLRQLLKQPEMEAADARVETSSP